MINSIKSSVFYHIYPLGFCGVINNKKNYTKKAGLSKIDDKWINHFTQLGINSIYFGPLFQSTYHGYDTIDYLKIDDRLGTNADFKQLVRKLHDNNISVIVDGVFNHVGREFWAFKDVIDKKSQSPYTSWFNINFNGNSNYNDGFYYEGWEGHYDLVKLNLYNKEVKNYLFEVIEKWINEFEIDGIRLDVAYLLPKEFLKELREKTTQFKNDFWLMGEMIHGDYNSIASPEMLHSATNYELYKGLYSGHNEKNYFEIAYSLNREFGDYGIYKNIDLYNFVDNHDVSRIASQLTNERHLPLIYGMLFGMPGIPCVYYGSEWGTKANKSEGDPALRVSFEKPEWNDLTELISKMAEAHKNSKALCYGSIKIPVLTNRQCIIEREFEGERVLVAINADDQPFTAHFDAGCGQAEELLTGTIHDFGGGSELKPYSVEFWKMER